MKEGLLIIQRETPKEKKEINNYLKSAILSDIIRNNNEKEKLVIKRNTSIPH